MGLRCFLRLHTCLPPASLSCFTPAVSCRSSGSIPSLYVHTALLCIVFLHSLTADSWFQNWRLLLPCESENPWMIWVLANRYTHSYNCDMQWAHRRSLVSGCCPSKRCFQMFGTYLKATGCYEVEFVDKCHRMTTTYTCTVVLSQGFHKGIVFEVGSY